MNPLTVLPANVRRYVYAVLVLAAMAYAAYNAADGDWLEALGSLLVALTGGMATANARDTTPANVVQDDGDQSELLEE